MPDSDRVPIAKSTAEEEHGHITASGSETVFSRKRLQLKKGPEKRSLLEQPISFTYSTEPTAKRAAMDEEGISGDELDFLEEEPASPLRLRPPSNFSSVTNSPNPLNGFRTTQPGVTVSKKLVIKNFKKKEKTAKDLFSSNWAVLEDSVKAIQSKRKIASSLEQLYKIVEHLCENRLGNDLYERLQNVVRDHVIAERIKLTADRDVSGEQFLSHVDVLWTDYCQQMTMIRDVFLFLDRTFILQNTAIMSIWEASLTIFREEIMENSYIQKRLVREVLQVIASERNGDQVDRNLLRSLLKMLSNMQIYAQVFESEFLNTTAELFSREGDTLSRELEAPAYLHHADRRLSEEETRVWRYLDETTRQPLLEIVDKCLIAKHIAVVIQKGLDGLLDDNKLEELQLAFNLFSRVKDGQTSLKNGLVAYIKRVGKAMVMNPERDGTMVESLMQFKDKIDTIVKDCFRDQEKFQQAERDAFSYFINTRPNKPAELIAKYMDSKLRSANKEASDEELDRLMDKVITLFRFIQGKDVFEAFYKKDLAKRLLLGRSASVDAEKAMLSKLKQECGAGFTHKLEGMFKDMELSKDLACAFKQHNEHESNLNKPSVNMDFYVNVLTLGQWPPYEPVEITLPAQLGSCLQLYQDFYVSKHNGRKLQWQHSLGQCVLKGNFRPGCVKELQVTLYQSVVLMLFNDCNEFTYDQIAAATKIEGKELKRTLISLACAKVRVLTKSPKGKDINPDDKFTVNSELQERLYRIKISQIQLKETAEEHKQTEEQVNQDRQYQIDAAVVRIMKTRKSLQHQQLIAELFGQLRFPVRSADLKKRISSLIERDYLCRDADDSNIYKYVT